MIETTPHDERSGELKAKVFLGEGSQVTVYDLGGGRIKKEPKSLEDAVVSIEKWYDGSSQGTSREYAEMLERYRHQGLEYIANLTEKHPETSWFFGNPTIHEDGSLEQDKLETLGDYMQRHATPEAKRAIINEYVGSIKTSWKLGCYDWTFNFLNNCGVNEQGAVVMLDFGEMGYDEETMHNIIDQKKWESAYDVVQLDDETREYYLNAMKETVTHVALTTRWRSIVGDEL